MTEYCLTTAEQIVPKITKVALKIFKKIFHKYCLWLLFYCRLNDLYNKNYGPRGLLAALRRLEIYLVCDLILRGNFCIDVKLILVYIRPSSVYLAKNIYATLAFPSRTIEIVFPLMGRAHSHSL